MRALLLYLLPIILLLLSLFAIGSRRSAADDQEPPDGEYSDARVFLRIFAVGGAIAVGIFAALEFS
jgi:hypothetical protein